MFTQTIIGMYSRRKSLERAKSLERSAKKALNSTKKAFYLDFQIFPEKYSPLSILYSKKKFKKFYLKSDYRCYKFFFDFWKVPIMSVPFFLGMSQHPSTGIFKHVLHWGW